MIDAHIIKIVPDSDDGRSNQYAFCEDSLELRDTVVQLLKHLDMKLGERIGKDERKALKKALRLIFARVSRTRHKSNL